MKVYKFGGASVRDARAVENVFQILKKVADEDVLIVISAMGKSTNRLEEILSLYLEGQSLELSIQIANFKKTYLELVNQLFHLKKVKDQMVAQIDELFSDFHYFLSHNRSSNYSYVYDQVVSLGEILSTKIMAFYLQYKGIKNKWLDARDVLLTDSTYREAKLNWDQTIKRIEAIEKNKLPIITQGFIASNGNGATTTLGREGSDYSAAIFAYCLKAEQVCIWKDVPGVLNADPREFNQTTLLNKISYQEAIELAYYGASVIHPKTIQPLQRRKIPLYVRSFVNPEKTSTEVCDFEGISPEIPCYIVKKDQYLLSLSSLDFSFILEKHLSEAFALFDRCKIKVNLIQNTAISFSVCVEDKYERLEELSLELSQLFKVEIVKNVKLYTIRYAREDSSREIELTTKVLIKQQLKQTLQLVVL